MALLHLTFFSTKKDLLNHFFKNQGRPLSNERITELAFFRMAQTNEMVKKQEKAIEALLRKHPVSKRVMARLKKEFGL